MLLIITNNNNFKFVLQYCWKFVTEEPFQVSDTCEEEVLQIIKTVETSKAVGMQAFQKTFERRS